MAIRSALSSSYIINEEQDGFVAVDFEEDRLDLTAWEFVDADVDDCSSTGDDVSESGESAGSDVSSEYCAKTVIGEDVDSLPELSMSPEYFDGEDDDCFSIAGRSDDVSERIIGGDEKSVPETIISPVYSEENIVVKESIMSPEYVTEKIAGYSDCDTAYQSRGEKYCYEEEDDLEEDDYDLDDELVPYYVNCKLGRERMRKLGKRSCVKSVKSKRLTHNYNKPGCFRGKHGLGLKHSLM